MKELWGNNKVLIVLGGILVVCFIAILIVTFSFFLGGSKSVYGDRLKKQENVKVTDNFKNEYIASLTADKDIESAKVEVKGAIIYVTINFVGDISLNDAKSKTAASLASFSEEILGVYDLGFTIKSPKTENTDGFTMLGAKNVAGTGLSWRNDTQVESEE